ncbi:MAG: cyclic nucleotide-binding domain-containing protein, partial [Deltaproteobacteria bacterium]|nr:cyclic nucleotide-binding domain-containing protein [Deltaproteobacteria bacterium]
AGGALGNVVIIGALALGSALWVGYAALPIAVAWLVASLLLWRRYPRLLLAASASRSRYGDALEGEALLDPATVRALVPEICSEDAGRCRIALDLVSEAEPERAISALAEAAVQAPETTRPLVIATLDRVLERAVTQPLHLPEAAERLEALLADPGGLDDRHRADLVQAYGRLASDDQGVEALARALADPAAAVRLAALAALDRRGATPAGAPSLDAVLEAAVSGEDRAARRTAREEFRALLLCNDVGEAWKRRIELLATTLRDPADRAEAAEAIAEVAAHHGEQAACVSDHVLALREDPDPRVRAALLRYSGHAGLLDQTCWLVDHLAADREQWVAAAREGLSALGPSSSETLLRELSYGKRSKREGILEVIRELDVRPETLRALYEGELDAVEHDLLCRQALGERAPFALLSQRLEERVSEELHTALLFLAAIRHEDRIAELGDRLQRARDRLRQRAILLEALESLLPADETGRLIPLLEDPGLGPRQASRHSLVPTVEQTLRDLCKDPEEITRMIASSLAVADGYEVEEHDGVDTVEKALHLKALPIFEGLTVRQLMDLAEVVKESALPRDTVVVHQGDYDDCLYLVLEGVVFIKRGETLLAEIGPGGFFGEIALFEGTARTATAVTGSRSRLLGLERSDLMQLIEEMPGIAICMLQTQSRRVRELTDRLIV